MVMRKWKSECEFLQGKHHCSLLGSKCVKKRLFSDGVCNLEVSFYYSTPMELDRKRAKFYSHDLEED